MSAAAQSPSPDAPRFDPGSVRRAPSTAWPDTYEATIRGRPVAVFRCGQDILAVTRYCPHKGADLTRRGLPDIEHSVLICLAHAHTFRMADGRCTRQDGCSLLPMYLVDFDPATELDDPARTASSALNQPEE